MASTADELAIDLALDAFAWHDGRNDSWSRRLTPRPVARERMPLLASVAVGPSGHSEVTMSDSIPIGRRIVVVGPTCSGKSTIAATLAERLDMPWGGNN